MDPRNKTLAKNLVNYSVNLQKGERVLIEVTGPEAQELIAALIREVYAVGGVPYLKLKDPYLNRELLLRATEEQISLRAKTEEAFMKEMNAWIGIRSGLNIFEMVDVPTENLNMVSKAMRGLTDERLSKKWVVLRYPTPSMAQAAKKSLEEFKNFYYDVCNLDYAKMDKAQNVLKALMEKTDKVHIKGPGTDLKFSIKGIPVIKCSGEKNIPDGEIFTAPVKESVEGQITYNIPSLQNGFSFENVCLVFEKGKIVKSTANDTDKIIKIFDRDEGARYVGEFSLGLNPYITEPMYDTLFDEKISGSFHFTPGNAYDYACNGNKSALHWDLVSIQTPEYGGGEIYFDDVLIRKDGLFVPEELHVLNPENLK